jgi:hypothetical protein
MHCGSLEKNKTKIEIFDRVELQTIETGKSDSSIATSYGMYVCKVPTGARCLALESTKRKKCNASGPVQVERRTSKIEDTPDSFLTRFAMICCKLPPLTAG